jgi:hypothetical protein
MAKASFRNHFSFFLPHLLNILPSAKCSIIATALPPMPITFKLGAPATIKIVPQFPCSTLGKSGPLIVMVAQKPPAAGFG